MNNDLISRKALLEDCLNRLNRFGASAFEFENCFPYWIFHKAITEAPVVDAEPVQRGEWINGCECSVCGQAYGPVNKTYAKNYHYCTYCGARMTERKETKTTKREENE